MKPPTPQHPKHDSACPYCGEPFKARKFLGFRLGDYSCGRCNGTFSIIGKTYYIAGKMVPSWVGPPLPATGVVR